MVGIYCHLLAEEGNFFSRVRNWLAVWDIWSQTHNAAQSLETQSLLCTSTAQPAFSISFMCFSENKRMKQRLRGAARTHVSRTQVHSSRSCLQHPLQNKPSSLWAACYSQCEFPNGHNGGQDHLLLLEGEVCIRLQLRRKTSWCL